jgi:hypothetical protein
MPDDDDALLVDDDRLAPAKFLQAGSDLVHRLAAQLSSIPGVWDWAID